MDDIYLIGIDGSNEGQRAADFAAARALQCGARLVLAYVIEWSPYSFHSAEELATRHQRRETEIERAKTEVLEPIRDRLMASGLHVSAEVRHGHPAKTMVELAHETGARQIFIGRKGSTGLGSMLFGSVAGTLVQIAPVPVTVVP